MAVKLKPEGWEENCPVHRPGRALEEEAAAGRQSNRREGQSPGEGYLWVDWGASSGDRDKWRHICSLKSNTSMDSMHTRNRLSTPHTHTKESRLPIPFLYDLLNTLNVSVYVKH